MVHRRQHVHLDLKHGKVVAGAHAAAGAEGDEGACPAPLLTQPPAEERQKALATIIGASR